MQTVASAIFCPPLEDDMPLNATDKAWINQTIQEASKRHGLGKLAQFIKDWSGVGAAAAILIVLFTQISGYIEFRATTQERLRTIEGNFSTLPNKIEALNVDLQKLTVIIEGLRLKELSTTPTDPRSVTETTELLNDARSKKISIDTTTVVESGSTFLGVSQTSRSVWPVVLAFLNYRSFLNAPAPREATKVPENTSARRSSEAGWILYASKTHMDADHPGAGFGPFPPTMNTVTNTAWSDNPEGMSIYEPIGTNRNRSITNGPSFLVLNGTGQDIKLDGFMIRHIEFDNLHIIYNGGPVILQDARFVNCTFDIQLQPPGIHLSNNILQSQNVNFKYVTS